MAITGTFRVRRRQQHSGPHHTTRPNTIRCHRRNRIRLTTLVSPFRPTRRTRLRNITSLNLRTLHNTNTRSRLLTRKVRLHRIRLQVTKFNNSSLNAFSGPHRTSRRVHLDIRQTNLTRNGAYFQTRTRALSPNYIMITITRRFRFRITQITRRFILRLTSRTILRPRRRRRQHSRHRRQNNSTRQSLTIIPRILRHR